MTSVQILAKVKNRLDIPSATTTWDVILADLIDGARARLFPRVSLEVDPQTVTSFTFADSEIVLDLVSDFNEDIHAARKVEFNTGTDWADTRDFYHHGTKLRIRDVPNYVTQLRVYGLAPFTDIEDVPERFLQAIYWYAMGEFYDYLSGNNSQYNIYIQTSGARGVDNMNELSAYFDTKADRFLDENGQKYGN